MVDIILSTLPTIVGLGLIWLSVKCWVMVAKLYSDQEKATGGNPRQTKFWEYCLAISVLIVAPWLGLILVCDRYVR